MPSISGSATSSALTAVEKYLMLVDQSKNRL